MSSNSLVRWFDHAHLPEHLARVSERFGDLARWIDSELPECAEKTVALRKLLEAKDAAVRARLDATTPGSG